MPDYSGLNILITGGAGFVGSNLTRRLVAEKAQVTVIDDMFTGSLDNLKDIQGKYAFLPVSVTVDYKDLQKIISETDIIFHLAARNIIASTKNPCEDYATNIGGTLNILMLARELNVKRVVYTSSASVYGNPRYLPINEDDQINLLTPYAVSKFAGEGYCMAFHESYGTSVAVLRLSNVYGTGQSVKNPYCGVVAKFMDETSRNEPIEIHGDGNSTRDFTFVDDVIEALFLAGLSPHADGEVFNVATGIETSVNTLADNIINASGHYTQRIRHIDRRDIDNIRRRVLNIEKIRRKLGWTPRVTLQEGLRRTMETKAYA